jgi:hypothetical protein
MALDILFVIVYKKTQKKRRSPRSRHTQPMTSLAPVSYILCLVFFTIVIAIETKITHD